MKPYILITNDDGLHAPGIRALYDTLINSTLLATHDIIVVAPATEQSATGLSITVRNPIRVEKHLWNGATVYGVTGTPADSVKMALSVILKRKPELILSGINRGSNAGKNILYSGTVSAVIEGALRDIPGIAFSCYDYHDTDYSTATDHIPEIIRYTLAHPIPLGSFFNINFPEKKHLPYKGFKLGRQGMGYWRENPDARSHPSEGGDYWWLGMKHVDCDEHEESDIALLAQGYITTVPVSIADLTHNVMLAERKASFESFFTKANSMKITQ